VEEFIITQTIESLTKFIEKILISTYYIKRCKLWKYILVSNYVITTILIFYNFD
jgi:hypothetical protein